MDKINKINKINIKQPWVLYGDDILIEISREQSVGFFYSIKKDTHLFLKDLKYFTNNQQKKN